MREGFPLPQVLLIWIGGYIGNWAVAVAVAFDGRATGEGSDDDIFVLALRRCPC